MHKKLQKRIHTEESVYFVAANTYNHYPYFKEDIFCRLLIDEIKLCRQLKKFEIFAYKINPDLIHLLIQPDFLYYFSTIVQFIKRNSSQNINKILELRKFKNMPNFWNGEYKWIK